MCQHYQYILEQNESPTPEAFCLERTACNALGLLISLRKFGAGCSKSQVLQIKVSDYTVERPCTKIQSTAIQQYFVSFECDLALAPDVLSPLRKRTRKWRQTVYVQLNRKDSKVGMLPDVFRVVL